MDRSDALKALGMDDVEGAGRDPNEVQAQKGSGEDDRAMADGEANDGKKDEMVDEDDVREQEIADENYQIWKKNTPLLYDLVIVCYHGSIIFSHFCCVC